jgi:hypothetical protein
VPCLVDAQGLYKLGGRAAKHTFESPIKVAQRHAYPSRQSINGKIFMQISHDPRDEFRKPIDGLTIKHRGVREFLLAIAIQ